MYKLTSFLRNQSSGKFRQDVLWNFTSLAIMGTSGILLNVLIFSFYDAETLGVFNQVFSAFIFFSQLAGGGFHLSTLKHVAEFSSEKHIAGTIIVASLIVTSAFSFVMSGIFWLSRGFIGDTLSSPGVAEGIAWATPGLFLFAVNKVMLAALNGFRRMKHYALFQSLRVVFMVASLLAAIFMSCPGEKLPLVFSTAEIIIFFGLLFVVGKHICLSSLENLREWMARHLEFGLKSFLSSTLLELNTKIDILILGYFAGDKTVGIYSFAAMLIEGIYQFMIVLRINYNPLLVKLIAGKKLSELKAMINKGKKVGYLMMSVLGMVAVMLYPMTIKLFTDKPDLLQSWPFFGILMTGIVLGSGYIPFRQILLVAGYPGLHTIMMLTLVILNIIGDFLFIPFWGGYGAALASASTVVFSVFMVKYLTKARIGITI
jgi:O-antigen/teichoic acid export membrane protein